MQTTSRYALNNLYLERDQIDTLISTYALSRGYRYGSDSYRNQGQEKDDVVRGKGNSVNYTYRMHDPRIGRFFAVDLLTSKYPWNSSYAFSENRVIDGRELEGLEYVPSILATDNFYSQIGMLFADDVEKESWINKHTVNHKGVDYINLGFHVYSDGDGCFSRTETIDCIERVSLWVYYDIQLYDKEKHHAFGWKDPKLVGKSKSDENLNANEQCADLAEAQGIELGARQKKGAISQSVMIVAYDARIKLIMDNDEAIDYINRQLERKKPVVVGVDYKKGGTDVGTDHYLTITGRTEINGNGYFLFMENARNYQKIDEIADFINNKLIVTDKGIQRNKVHVDGTYKVTRVQLNKE